MLGKSLRYALLASGLALTTAISFAPAAFAVDPTIVRGTASNQITGNLDASASISWPQPNAFAIKKPTTAADQIQYVTLSTNVSYDANVPWMIKGHSLNGGSLVNADLASQDEKIGYKFALGIGSQGTTSVAAPFVKLLNDADGTKLVSGIPGQGELVPKLELTIPVTGTPLVAGQFTDTITLFMLAGN